MFYTVNEGQTSLHVQVTEGEDSDPDFVKVIGRSNLDLRGPKPQGYPVRFILHMMKMALYTFMEKMKILVNI